MKVEIRGKQLLIEGYVNTVLRESKVLSSPKGPFIERILPQTFQKALERVDDVSLLFNHLESRKLGSIKQGNLELWEDGVGLRVKCSVSDNEVISKKNELRGWSFGFICKGDYWKDGPNGTPLRNVYDLDLTEVSLLTNQPAYTATSVNIVGEKRGIKEQRFGGFISAKEAIDLELRQKQLEIIKLKGGHYKWA